MRLLKVTQYHPLDDEVVGIDVEQFLSGDLRDECSADGFFFGSSVYNPSSSLT